MKPTDPLAAKSSPRSTVVPTAMYSLLPLSALDVSRVTQDMLLMNSLVENSKLRASMISPNQNELVMATNPSIVIQPSGEMSSSVEQSHKGSETFGAKKTGRVLAE